MHKLTMNIRSKKDEVSMAMTAFRIHHGLSEVRGELIEEKDLETLWRQWRIDHNLPLNSEKWSLEHECYENWLHCLDIEHDGRYIGKIELIMPPSPVVEELLKVKV
jgi:hypothetical protein